MKKINLRLVWLLTLLTAFAPGASAQRGADDLEPRERLATPRVQNNLRAARKLIRERKLGFGVGLTGVSERSLEELTGDVVSPNIALIAAQQNVSAAKILQVNPQQLLNIDLIKLPALEPFEIDKFGNVVHKSGKSAGGQLGQSENEKKAAAAAEMAKNSPQKCVAGNPSYDFRVNHFTVPVRRQQCGNCWAYAAEAVYEYAFIKRKGYVAYIQPFDTSEQFLVSNSGAGNCKGGERAKANAFLSAFGVMSEVKFPDTGTNGTPATNLQSLFPFLPKIATWGFVDANNEYPSVDSIKKAMCAYGPVSASIHATDAFMNYKTGVFDEGASGDTNHAIVIVGWDDAKGAWIIRNSWGSDWGNNAGYGKEGGYAYVKYNTNGVGRLAQWVVTQ